MRQPGWLVSWSALLTRLAVFRLNLIKWSDCKTAILKEVVQKHRTFGTQFPNN
jgi:hypothetical protein